MNKTLPALCLTVFSLLLPSCAHHWAAVSGEELQAELQESSLGFEDVDPDELAKRKPAVLEFPFRLAIAPPLVRENGVARFAAWTIEEKELLRTWCERYREVGILADYSFLPSALLPNPRKQATDLIKPLRGAGLRVRADAVLLLHSVSADYATTNALVVFDIALLPAVFMPSQRAHARTAMEAILLDTRTDQLHLTATGDSYENSASATAFLWQNLDAMRSQSRCTALEATSKRISELVQVLPRGR